MHSPGKTSGDVWVVATGVQPASLSDKATLKSGDSIRTGRNGRVLLTRGEEKILIAIPEKPGSSTTIVQQAGSILLQVEKRDSRTFEVETPYLVAAVKGTQFRVSLINGAATVSVTQGSVQVADNTSGKFALVMPGQTATASAHGGGSLSVKGTGVIGPILQGQPRASTVAPVPVPRGGLTAPLQANGRQVRALGVPVAPGSGAVLNGPPGVVRITVPLGEVKLDVHKATNGLAHAPSQSTRASPTVWRSGELTPGNGVGKTYNLGNNGSGNGLGSGNGSSAGHGNAGGSGSAGGNGNGNAFGGNGGNGNGNAFGLNGGNGNGNAYGLNGGNGKGHGYGHSK